MGLIFRCRRENDLYRLLCARDTPPPRYDTPAEALAAARAGDGVLILADGYPTHLTPVTPEFFVQAEAKRVRLYVEYPSAVPGIALGAPRYIRTGEYGAVIERTVVASDAFGPDLERLRILMIHDCTVQPTSAPSPHLVLARVAGYDRAEFGLPPETTPVLFELPNAPVMIATTRLSQFVTARSAPAEAWAEVWRMILQWLQPRAEIARLAWTPTVRPTLARCEPLPPAAEALAIRRGADWYQRSGLLPDRSWPPWIIPENPGTKGLPPEWPTGDGSCGIAECYISKRIFQDGSQAANRSVRTDCTGEAAMGLALSAAVTGTGLHARIAANLGDYLWLHSPMVKKDPQSPAYGLVGHNLHSQHQYYSDDNARLLLGSIAAAAALQTGHWDEGIARAILANFRVTGPRGYQCRACIEDDFLRQVGWEHCWRWEGTRFSPHFHSYIWAAFLWLYAQTRFTPLLDRARTGIRLMMDAYPDGWRSECGRMEEERVHMLLPLAWLVRVDDAPEHRRWLRMMAEYAIQHRDASGAIPQQVDQEYTANESYGSGEAAVAFRSGDPVTDLLYSMNFAFIGMHEAQAATGDIEYRRAADKMAEFLIRCQIRSEDRPELDGTWYRAFDFAKWDYWGSDGDAGWGVWTTETGWTHSWILATLALRQLKTSLWDVSQRCTAARGFEALRAEMLPKEIAAT